MAARQSAINFAITYRILGTEAVLIGEIGFPHGRPSTLRYQLRGQENWVQPYFARQWFPDAFGATMGELLLALEQDREPLTSGRDNLTTLRAVFAAYQSVAEHRAWHLTK
jgi:predicted dehydrogenase